MKPKVYVETSVISYLTSWLSRDLVVAARQQITQEWWRKRREDFDLFVAQAVFDECSAGDPDAAARRIAALHDLPMLEQSDAVTELAKHLVDQVPLPERASVDAMHIAVAAIHGMDFLMTWNCAHIANAQMRKPIEAVCRAMGCEPANVCTPEQLLLE